jgi:antitoxin component YwqK of YwqJK toxin-antitoxin module
MGSSDFTGEIVHDLEDGKVIVPYVSGKKNGRSKLVDGDGHVLAIIEYKEDLVDGEVKNFYRSGGVISIAHFKEGAQNGSFASFYENGMRQIESSYKAGQLEGTFIVYDEFGDKLVECVYRNGLKHGRNTVYYPKSQGGGICESSSFIDGLLEGDKVMFYDTGNILSITPYSRGRAQSYPRNFLKSGEEMSRT